MDDRIKKLLTEQKSVEDVNLDAQSNVLLTNTARPLPLNNISTTVSQSEQAAKERQESTKYRFYGSINPVVSNALYNDNIKIFIDKDPDNITLGQRTTAIVQSPDIVEDDGWFGYYDSDPFQAQNFEQTATDYNDNVSSLCQFIPFDPGYERLNFLDADEQPNYELKLTYPAYSRDDIKIVTNGTDSLTLSEGIPIISMTGVSFNDRDYTAFETALNHGLRPNDNINLYKLLDLTGSGFLGLNDREFKVVKLGDQLSDFENKYFILDINPNEIQVELGKSSLKRVVDGVESSYYMRVFSALTTEQTDYQIFPAAFATNIFSDGEVGFNFIKDIDLSEKKLRDNLGRPISEVYLTITKLRSDSSGTLQSEYWDDTTNKPFWTDITPGFITTNHPNVNHNVRGFGDTNINQTYFPVINSGDTEYMGDIVEYNTEELEERNLVDAFHRINTEFRENRSTYTIPTREDRKEGYIYKPHYRIKTRDFSTYIEEGASATTVGIPDYAIVSYSGNTGNVVMKWRDYLDVGIYDEGGRGVEYPFESGAHYVFLGSRFYLRRQDPPCDFEFTDLTYSLPGDEEELGKKLSDPKFVQILSITPTYTNTPEVEGDIVSVFTATAAPFDIRIVIRMVDYFGEYELGSRDVPGGCVDIGLISAKDMNNVC